MSTTDKIVRIFTMPVQLPCGPQSSCCGPVGQTEEQIQSLRNMIEEMVGVKTEVRNVMKGEDMKNFREIIALFRSLGPVALPIIAVGEEVVSVGNPEPSEAAELIKEKLQQSELTGTGGK